MELSIRLSSSEFDHLPSPPAYKSTRDFPFPPATTNILCDKNNLPMCTPHLGMPGALMKEMVCRIKERRFGGCRSETPSGEIG